ncbi:semaphorin-4F isoform X1 [Pleurodeles waltl]|uniref:semaphorin-4F isoform X1 n=2 Tax=Pleurodeles waltl TaxID=8319 RepID=UPI003709881D
MAAGARAPPLGAWALLLLTACAPPGTALLRSLVPRSAPTRQEVEQLVQRFSAEGVTNYSIFQVDNASRTLYVGSKDAIVSLSLDSVAHEKKTIQWKVPEDHMTSCTNKGKKPAECHNYIRILEFVNRTHLYTCGTYAFDPQCGYIDIRQFDAVFHQESGRGKCPFEPAQPSTVVTADGTLYAATMYNFLGTDPLISRATGNLEDRIRTDTSAQWLNDPIFVASSFVRESEAGEDDKLYFFFTETAKEYNFYKKMKVPRVARVCKSDTGGQKTLQKRWTTFLKTQLLCSDAQSGVHFNILQDVFTLPGHSWAATVFFGIFSSEWEESAVSAVCAYDILDIHKAMKGTFKEFQHSCDKWTTVPLASVPEPRPGTCMANFPDRVLTFIRDHPLMEQSVSPRNKVPMLVKQGTCYRKMAVRNVAALDGKAYNVLYLGTVDGHLHKAVSIRTITYILEDLSLFGEDQPVESLQLFENSLYVSSSGGVVQMNLTDCERHNSCRKCILSRDPACAWSVSDNTCVEHRRRQWLLQDIEFGNISTLCPAEKDSEQHPDKEEVLVTLGARVVLPCTPQSAWSSCEWRTPTNGTEGYTSRSDGLELTVKEENLGEYECHCWENQEGGLVAAYSLVTSSGQTRAVGSSGRTHAVLAGLICFVVGLMVGSGAYAFYQRKQQRRWEIRQQKTGLDLMPSNTTSCSHEPHTPSSPEDERHPLATDKKNGGLNGYTHYYIPEKDQARIILSNAPLAHCDETSI